MFDNMFLLTNEFPMRLGLVAACLTLSLAVPVAAQTPTPEDAVMKTVDACESIERGAAVASALAAVGYAAPQQGNNYWIRRIGEQLLYVGVTQRPQASGKVFHFCTVGIRGRLPDPARLRSMVESRARGAGFTVTPPKPNPGGGTIQSMTSATSTGMTGFSLIINDAADPAKSASFTLTYGWTR